MPTNHAGGVVWHAPRADLVSSAWRPWICSRIGAEDP